MMEYRNFDIDDATTDKETNALRLRGYAARYNTDSLPMDYKGETVVESIAPGAFDRTLEDPDVSLFWQHDPKMPLASTLSGTLNLRSDDNGLAFDATLPDTQLARDAMTLVRAGVVRQMSFGFFVREDDTSTPGRRILRDIDLREISIVERAAYSAAGVSARSFSLTRQRQKASLLLRKVCK